MTELLENSDNTNADTGVSESPANEATISLAAVQALADALQKIEAYTPTVWVDNESPDIDAVHLNKAEQAIMRVTTAMNSAVDVIKDLQSQVNTTNNNLSKCFSPQSTLSESADNCRRNGCWRINGKVQSVNGVDDGILLAFVADSNSNVVYQQLFNNVGSIIYIRKYWFGTWSSWETIALKSDLTQYITVEKTTDAYGQIALDKVYNIKNLFCMGDRRFASWVGDRNVRITDSTGEVIKNTAVKVIVGYKS